MVPLAPFNFLRYYCSNYVKGCFAFGFILVGKCHIEHFIFMIKTLNVFKIKLVLDQSLWWMNCLLKSPLLNRWEAPKQTFNLIFAVHSHPFTTIFCPRNIFSKAKQGSVVLFQMIQIGTHFHHKGLQVSAAFFWKAQYFFIWYSLPLPLRNCISVKSLYYGKG